MAYSEEAHKIFHGAQKAYEMLVEIGRKVYTSASFNDWMHRCEHLCVWKDVKPYMCTSLGPLLITNMERSGILE